MKTHKLWHAYPCWGLILLLGCGSPNDAPPATSSRTSPTDAVGRSADKAPQAAGQTSPPASSPEATGTLTGRVLFQGTVPPPRVIQVTKDQDVCMVAAGEVQDVAVGPDGGLADVVIEIVGIEWKGSWTPPEQPLVIRQKGCLFTPRILMAYDGAELTIYNDDPVEHNINTGQWNEVQGPSKQPITKTIRYGGQPYTRVTCNIHNWMECWVYVARTPYHSRTKKDGTFRIDGIPPGKYRATAMHPTLGRKRLKFEIAAGQTSEQEITFD